MEVSVVIERVDGSGYRAVSGEPLPAAVEAASREEALEQLRRVLEARVRAGAEIVRIQIDEPRTRPIWPDDEITRDWLEGIAEARAKAALEPDPWEEEP